MGFFDAIGKLLSGGEISFENTTHVNSAANLLTGDKQVYVGKWANENTDLFVKPDGTVEYRRTETIGDSTNTNTVSGPINAFDGASFVVGVMGNNTRFEVAEMPVNGSMTVNGERLKRVV